MEWDLSDPPLKAWDPSLFSLETKKRKLSSHSLSARSCVWRKVVGLISTTFKLSVLSCEHPLYSKDNHSFEILSNPCQTLPIKSTTSFKIVSILETILKIKCIPKMLLNTRTPLPQLRPLPTLKKIRTLLLELDPSFQWPFHQRAPPFSSNPSQSPVILQPLNTFHQAEWISISTAELNAILLQTTQFPLCLSLNFQEWKN